MNIAIYTRVSTKDRGQETENQGVQLRDFAAKFGPLVIEYVDHESGAKSDREQFQRMFEDASKRKFDMLLFWSLDRFSREGVLATLQHLNRQVLPPESLPPDSTSARIGIHVGLAPLVKRRKALFPVAPLPLILGRYGFPGPPMCFGFREVDGLGTALNFKEATLVRWPMR